MTHEFIRRSVLFLREVQDLPTVDRTLVLFERVLVKKGLSSLLNSLSGTDTTATDIQIRGLHPNTDVPPAHATAPPDPPHELPVLDPLEDSTMNFEDFLGFDFFNHIGVSGL